MKLLSSTPSPPLDPNSLLHSFRPLHALGGPLTTLFNWSTSPVCMRQTIFGSLTWRLLPKPMGTWSYSFIKKSVHCLIYHFILCAVVFNLLNSASLPHLKTQSVTIPQNLSVPIALSEHSSVNCTNRPKNVTDTALLDECLSRPLSPELWKELKLDEFLLDYPGGDLLTLPVRCDLKSATNEKCSKEKKRKKNLHWINIICFCWRRWT